MCQLPLLVPLLAVISQVVASQRPLNRMRINIPREVKVGVILTKATDNPSFENLPFTIEKVLPAILQAVEKIQNDPKSVLPGVKFVVNYRDSNCSQAYGPLAAISMYRTHSADVFFGPACFYPIAAVARYSGRWGIPVITPGALLGKFQDKTEFNLLTRVLGSFPEVSGMLHSVLQHFNWTRIGLLFRDDAVSIGAENRECLNIMKGVFGMFDTPPKYTSVEESGNVGWRKHVAGMSNNSRSE